jgi:two-component system, response regulator, stage 0 sporulation protein F
MENKIRVLYIDDEPTNLTLFTINFREKYVVFVSESAKKGLAILDEHPYIEVVISDMKMPNMNGVEFIKIAKKRYPEILFFILTGYELTGEIQEAIDTGLVIKYFSKPFNIADIDDSINQALLQFK